ncbi:MAG TPA: SAM-dependent methyltransferase [Candidatus Atribacteria bacterium]|nr:SAM-dependent methyltransferase [Candidatus Atribacteria bacterium]
MARIEPFEKYSEKYEDWFEKNKFVYESEIQAIKELFPKVKKSIEIGVGSGKFAMPLGIKIGIDPSPRMREIAEKRGIEVIDAIAEDLPFKNSQFELALMVTSICFVDNLDLTFKEIYRILKPGGYLIIGFIDKDSSLGKLYQQHKRESLFYKIATFYSVKEVVYNLSKAGFKEFNFRQTIFHGLKEIKDIEPAKEDYGEGSFVVIRARK